MISTKIQLNRPFTSMTVAALLAATFTGCGDKTPAPSINNADNRCIINNALAPNWVCGGSIIDGTITAVGSAQYSKIGEGFSRREAMANSRSNLAQQIQTHVKDKVETFANSTGVGGSEVADKVSTQVSKQVAKVTLNGSKQMKFWQNPNTKDIYILIGVAQDSMNNEIKEQVKSSYKSDDALWQQFKAKQAMESLEKEFPSN